LKITLRAMAKNGCWAHEHYLDETSKYLTVQGFRIIRLNGKSPDLIAVSKDGKSIFAIDAITHSKDGKDRQDRANRKISDYMELGFDNVFALLFDKYDSYETMRYATNGKRHRSIDSIWRQTTLWEVNLAEKRAKWEAEKQEFIRRYEESRKNAELIVS
jgi:hypothetical protein